MKKHSFIAVLASLTVVLSCSSSISAMELRTENGLKYSVSDSGEKSLYSGWTKRNGKYYYYSKGKLKKNCWISSKGVKKYYLTADGSRAVGDVVIKGQNCHFDSNGVYQPDHADTSEKSLIIRNITADSCVIEYKTDNKEMYLTEKFDILGMVNGKWEKLTPKYKNYPWSDNTERLGNGTVIHRYEWCWLYGSLPEGDYRIGITLVNKSSDGKSEEITEYIDFSISSEQADMKTILSEAEELQLFLRYSNLWKKYDIASAALMTKNHRKYVEIALVDLSVKDEFLKELTSQGFSKNSIELRRGRYGVAC